MSHVRWTLIAILASIAARGETFEDVAAHVVTNEDFERQLRAYSDTCGCIGADVEECPRAKQEAEASLRRGMKVLLSLMGDSFDHKMGPTSLQVSLKKALRSISFPPCHLDREGCEMFNAGVLYDLSSVAIVTATRPQTQFEVVKQTEFVGGQPEFLNDNPHFLRGQAVVEIESIAKRDVVSRQAAQQKQRQMAAIDEQVRRGHFNRAQLQQVEFQKSCHRLVRTSATEVRIAVSVVAVRVWASNSEHAPDFRFPTYLLSMPPSRQELGDMLSGAAPEEQAESPH
jgi:hypothetical protein